jgi:16S rRNA (adenine1518-N6/adenine1519-N6)-dimethyltransferase
VGRGHFTPPPKVDSAILAITNISHTQLPTPDATEHFFTLLHLGFGQKRKQLRGNLSALYDRNVIESCFKKLGIKDTARGEDLDVNTWLALAQTLKPITH